MQSRNVGYYLHHLSNFMYNNRVLKSFLFHFVDLHFFGFFFWLNLGRLILVTKCPISFRSSFISSLHLFLCLPFILFLRRFQLKSPVQFYSHPSKCVFLSYHHSYPYYYTLSITTTATREQ